MPSSNAQAIPEIIQLVRRLKPKSVLDVGAGYGKYGFLIREYIDRFERQIRIDAVEANADLPRKQLLVTYDDVYFADWLLFTPARRYDLVLMIDVLEHWEKPEGFMAINRALEAGKRVLISTPFNPAPQEGRWEAHRSRWTKAELCERYNFQSYSNRTTLIGTIKA